MTNHTREVRGRPAIDAPPLESGPGADYDALADLFLGEGPTPASVQSASAAAPSATVRIEGLIIGHLPVLASAWVTQYAKHLAEQDRRPVGLLRVRAGQVSVDAVFPADGAVAAPAPAATLDEALAAAARVVGRWVVRVDELAEPRLAEMTGIDAVTLLTGADEAAVVASYRTIKRMTERPEDGEREVPFGIAVMGSTAERARDAAERLSRTASMHIGRPVPLTACVPQIGPGRVVTLFRADTADPGELLVARAIAAIRSACAAPPEPVKSATRPEPVAPRVHAARNGGCPVRVVTGPEPDQWDPEPSGPPDLVAQLPDLIALPAGAQSPYAPDVRLAFDRAGGLHLLAWAGSGRETAAVQRLVEVSAWAAAHDGLLRMAAGRTALPGAPTPVLHVFTADARAVRRLLDASIRVHVLVPVPAGASWVAADLN